MKKHKKLFIMLSVLTLACVLLAAPAYAVTEQEVQNAVARQGKEAVTGNVFVWFMCAVAFLKASQKIDSFMASLGVNVGHTGGSMLAEALIAARGISIMAGGKGPGRGMAGMGAAGKTSGHTESAVTDARFLQGGAFGAAQRQIARGAVKSATGSGAGLSSAIGGATFVRSLSKGGKFAADVTGAIAHGRIGTSGSLTGEKAAQALAGYIPPPAAAGGAAADTAVPPISTENSGLGAGMEDAGPVPVEAAAPIYTSVEIGGGHITGYETPAGGAEATQFAMYSAEQYAQPEGGYQTVTAVDGSKWYKQYAEAAVKRTPDREIKKGGQSKVLYNETIVQQLPKPPQRKEKL